MFTIASHFGFQIGIVKSEYQPSGIEGEILTDAQRRLRKKIVKPCI